MSKSTATKAKKVSASRGQTKAKATANANTPKQATARGPAPKAKSNGAAARKATAKTQPVSPAVQRLAPGELRALVKAFLAQHRGEYFTPVQVRKALDAKSAGGVWVALEKLVLLNEADKASDPPQRYRIRAQKGTKRSAKR